MNPPLDISVCINGEYYWPKDVGGLERCIAVLSTWQYSEIWLDVERGPELFALFNADRVLMTYLRHDGDAGYTSRDEVSDQSEKSLLDFYLSNGQRDQYPASWSVPLPLAIDAMKHFFVTGERSPAIRWHNDNRKQRPH